MTSSENLDVASLRMISQVEDAEAPVEYGALRGKGRLVADGLIQRGLIVNDGGRLSIVSAAKGKKGASPPATKKAEKKGTFAYSSSFVLALPAAALPVPPITRPLVAQKPQPRRMEKERNSVDLESFGLFWDKVEGVPSWTSLDRVGKSPSGYPDERRDPPKETNMVEEYKKEPHTDEGKRETWKFLLGCAGLMVAAVCVIVVSIIWTQIPPQVRIFIIAIPYGLATGSRVVWLGVVWFAFAMLAALKAGEIKDALARAVRS